MSLIETCIYCRSTFDPTQGECDHIIPARFGEFRNDTRFRRICPTCNSKIGQAEEQMIRSGPEALYLRFVKSKRGARRGSSPRGAAGAPPLQYTMTISGQAVVVEPSQEGPSTFHPPSYRHHIVCIDEHGQETRIPIHPNMSCDKLRRALVEADPVEVKLPYYIREDQEKYRALFEKSGIEIVGSETMPAGTYPQQRVNWKSEPTTEYFRAVAKIGFHYYLAHSSRYRGDEDHFCDIRNFIMNGGNKEDFIDQQGHPRFCVLFDDLMSGGAPEPGQWCHVLGAFDFRGQAFAVVALFFVPQHRTYCVTLARRTPQVAAPAIASAHVYLYDNPQRPGSKYAGRVEPLCLKIEKPR